MKKWIILMTILLLPFQTKAMTNPQNLTPQQMIAQKIAYYSYHIGVPENLAVEIAKCESGLNQSAVSKTADFGVMQINKKYNGARALKMGFDIYDTEDNIRFGLWLIKNDGLFQSYSASSKCWIKNITLLFPTQPSG